MLKSARKFFSPAALLLGVATAVIYASHVEAHMYQWTNASTGTVQLSGSPPAWYTSARSGPRLFVFDNGALIDDTKVLVSEELRQRLRSSAFELIDIADSDATPTATESEDELRDTLENATREGIDVNAVAEAFTAEKREGESDEGMVEQTVAELKALLDAWDSRRLIEAQTLLQNAARVGK